MGSKLLIIEGIRYIQPYQYDFHMNAFVNACLNKCMSAEQLHILT